VSAETPEGWASCKIGEVTQIVSGGTPPSKDLTNFTTEGGIPWITPADLSGYKDIYISRGSRNLSEKGFWACSATKIPQGSVLFSSRAPVGYVAIAANELTTNQGFKSFVLPKDLDSRFVYFYLKHIKPVAEAMATGTTFKELSGSVAAQLPLLIAPSDEQRRIADKLDSLLARVNACRDRLDRVSPILKQFRQSVINAATSGELTKDWRRTLQENEDRSNELPIDWQICILTEIAEVIDPNPKHRNPKYFQSGFPFLSTAQFGDIDGWDLTQVKYVNEETVLEQEARCNFRNGSLAFSRKGTIGKVRKLPTDIRFALLDSVCVINPLDNQNSDYLKIALEAKFVQEQVDRLTRGVALKQVSVGDVRTLEIPLPSLDEQHEIIRRVRSLLAFLDICQAHCQNTLTRVERLTPVLLDKAFRGELVPQDPDDEPASALLKRIQAEKNRMESEQKNTRTAKRTTKEKPKAPVRQSIDDYVEAIRSAFKQLGDKVDASQLFDQSGCRAEEVVQFYEALRAIPEVRIAFEKSRQERPPRKQNTIAKSADDQTSENGRFRLRELWLEDFKNLADYTVRFDPSHGIDIVLGWNGTGKSNLFEALVIIFRDLYKWWEKNQWTENPMKGYHLRYVMNRKMIEVSWQPGVMKRPKLRMGILQEGKEEPDKFESLTRDKLLLPRFIFGYYSGPTNRLAEHFLPIQQDHYNLLREEKSDDPEILANLLRKRRFFCAENHHAKYVLLAFFHKEDPAIGEFLEDRLRIVGFESALFVIRKPRWAKSGQTAENFWGARGVMRHVMEKLRKFAVAPMVVKQNVREGYTLKNEEHYYFFLPDLQSLHAFAAEYQDARTFFLALESIDFSELIYDLKIQVRVQATKTEQVAITFHELSEGEQQLLMVLGLMRFTKSHQSLVLLDEPDTHLNPHWSVDYLKLLTRVMSESSDESEEQQTSQILMSTHDPLVIASLLKKQIHLLKRDWQTGACKWDQPDVDPRGLGFTGILTSEMFGMRSDLDEETLADLDTKVRLVAKEDSLTPEEAIELEEINERLEDAGFQKAFSDPYYAAFIRAWSRRYSDLMAGARFLSPEQQEEIDRISREVLEEAIAELQAEAVG
jgi:restriction endonuclease S subunit/predicted ATPase